MNKRTFPAVIVLLLAGVANAYGGQWQQSGKYFDPSSYGSGSDFQVGGVAWAVDCFWSLPELCVCVGLRLPRYSAP
jgi:hypothetical protein